MLLKAAPAFGLLNSHGENPSGLFSSASSSVSIKNFEGRNGNGFVVCAAKHSNSKPLTGVVFQPFEEVKKELMLVPSVPQDSLARHKYADECEAAINEQIKWVLIFFGSNFHLLVFFCVWNFAYDFIWSGAVSPSFHGNWIGYIISVSGFFIGVLFGDYSVEYNVSYVYHAMYAYFDRDNVALKGLAT